MAVITKLRKTKETASIEQKVGFLRSGTYEKKATEIEQTKKIMHNDWNKLLRQKSDLRVKNQHRALARQNTTVVIKMVDKIPSTSEWDSGAMGEMELMNYLTAKAEELMEEGETSGGMVLGKPDIQTAKRVTNWP